MRPDRLAWGLAFAAVSATAQLLPVNPDWKELEAPPPPAFKLQGLIPLELPGSALRFGVDPASVMLGADGIVRYVVVASSPTGTVNAMYEGLRCGTAEVKTYARHNPDSGWNAVSGAEWRPLHGNSPSRHSLIIARTGACVGQGPNRSAAMIVKDLRSPVDSRFSNDVR